MFDILINKNRSVGFYSIQVFYLVPLTYMYFPNLSLKNVVKIETLNNAVRSVVKGFLSVISSDPVS